MQEIIQQISSSFHDKNLQQIAYLRNKPYYNKGYIQDAHR